MPLAEVLTIEVGASIAKWILKRWLKDSPLGDDISSNLIDVLMARTSDILAAREGNRQFEKIGEQVGKTLIPLFEREGAQLDEGSKIAVAYEVAAAFDKSRLSSELLAKLNLEPTELARYILAGHIIDPSFSEDEKALYERIIQVSCSYIVDIASQLPAFNERTFAEVLQREDQLIAIARQLLDESRRIRELLPTTDAGKFEGEYREGIVRKLDWLELFGTDVSTASKRHRLSVAYITLSPGLPQDTSGTSVRQLFVERSGMIREPVAGRVDFTHRTFQEFLAANATKEESDTGFLVGNAHNDQWREVIILAAGLMTR